MNLQELKLKTPEDLLTYADDLGIESASILRKQDLMFSVLKQLADNGTAIFGSGVLEILKDGFGFLRSPEANYLPGPDAPGTPSKARSARPRTASGILPWCK